MGANNFCDEMMEMWLQVEGEVEHEKRRAQVGCVVNPGDTVNLHENTEISLDLSGAFQPSFSACWHTLTSSCILVANFEAGDEKLEALRWLCVPTLHSPKFNHLHSTPKFAC